MTNLGKRMPEAETGEQLDGLHVYVQSVMQLRSMCQDQDPEKDRQFTPHFILSVVRGPYVVKVSSIIDLCGLRI